MKILLTGAAGFVGFHTAMEFSRLGHEVICLDNFNSYYSVDLKNYRTELLSKNGLTVHNLDLNNRERLKDFIVAHEPQAIIHLAAQAGVRLKPTDFYRYTESNLLGFCNILELAGTNGVENFLYASSSSVYGNSPHTPYREDDKEIQPISYYGATKLANELLAKSFSLSTVMRTRGMRFFTAYGPIGRPDMAYFKLITAALTGRPFYLNGDGQLKRDFTYISDIVNSIYQLSIELTRRENSFSDSVNIGGGNPVSISNLISEIEFQTGSKIHVVNSDKIKADVLITESDTSYLRNLTSNTPQVDLSSGIELTLEWSKQPDVLSKLRSWADL